MPCSVPPLPSMICGAGEQVARSAAAPLLVEGWPRPGWTAGREAECRAGAALRFAPRRSPACRAPAAASLRGCRWRLPASVCSVLSSRKLCCCRRARTAIWPRLPTPPGTCWQQQRLQSVAQTASNSTRAPTLQAPPASGEPRPVQQRALDPLLPPHAAAARGRPRQRLPAPPAPSSHGRGGAGAGAVHAAERAAQPALLLQGAPLPPALPPPAACRCLRCFLSHARRTPDVTKPNSATARS